MIENEPARMNVPATRDAIRSMTEASGAERRSFRINAHSHAQLRTADC